MGNLQDIKPEKVFIELNDRQLELRYDLNAFAELEEVYGTVDKAMKAMEDGSIRAIRVMLWAGLVHAFVKYDSKGMVENYGVTPIDVGSWLTPANMEEVSKKLAQALVKSLPKNKEQPKDLPKELQEHLAKVVLTAEEEAEEERKKL